MLMASLIVLIPALSFVVLVCTGKRLGDKAGYVAIGATTASLLIAAYVLKGAIGAEGHPEVFRFAWGSVGPLPIEFGWLIDGLSASMLVMVSFVSLMIQVYSLGYMHGDSRFGWFYAVISLFTASMLGLVSASNLLAILVFWEIMGLCSYLLIGFWYEKEEARKAAIKAFITTRIGDIGFLAAVALVMAKFGTMDLPTIFTQAKLAEPGFVGLVTLLLFWGAMGKSAQFPLHVWLPDAMAGPTPVSALLHSATMVAAGVFLVARNYPLFMLANSTLRIVAIVGIFTAIFAASLALVENDIKRILAYSTVSQLGYMMGALGVGGFVPAVFHLLAHAFFKSMLFLGAGSAIHASHCQDIKEMGGLGKKMPYTAVTFLVGALALSGIPPLSGFFSKDSVLDSIWLASGESPIVDPVLAKVLFVAGLITAAMTAFYMFRLYINVFLGDKESHAHESTPAMVWPMTALAAVTLAFGFVNTPWKPFLGEFLPIAAGHEEVNIILMVSSAIVASGGIAFAWAVYGAKVIPTSAFSFLEPWARAARRRYYLDDLYDWAIVKPTLGLAYLLRLFDVYVVDGLVNLAGGVGVGVSVLSGLFDVGVVDGIVNVIGYGAVGLGKTFRKVQTGQVSNYFFFMVILGSAIYMLMRGGW